MLAAAISFSVLRCVPLPTPAWPKLIAPGFARARATKSASDLCGEAGVHHQHVRRQRQRHDVDEVLGRVVGQLGVDRRIDRVRVGIDEQRVAVGRRLRHRRRADRAAGAGTVLDHHRLAPVSPTSFARHEAPDDVGRARRRERDDHVHRLVRVLGLRVERAGREQARGPAISLRLDPRGLEDLAGLLDFLLHEFGELRDRQISRHGAELGQPLAQVRAGERARSRPC